MIYRRQPVSQTSTKFSVKMFITLQGPNRAPALRGGNIQCPDMPRACILTFMRGITLVPGFLCNETSEATHLGV